MRIKGSSPSPRCSKERGNLALREISSPSLSFMTQKSNGGQFIVCLLIHDIILRSSDSFPSGTSPEIGGIRGMYNLLKQAAIDTPVQGNEGGSYLTMRSNQGITFGAAIMISGMFSPARAKHPNIFSLRRLVFGPSNRLFRGILRSRYFKVKPHGRQTTSLACTF